jgi:alpha-tubulin suppressor-like RCC1 family protein
MFLCFFALLVNSAHGGLLAAGYLHTCAVQANEDLYCWGTNQNKQLGLGTSSTSTAFTPVKMIVGSAVQSVSLGNGHSCVVTNGAAKCVGGGSVLGDGITTTNTGSLVQVVDAAFNIRDITCGYYHSCIITIAGVVSCFGRASSGALANGVDSGDFLSPVQISGSYSGVLSVSAGKSFTCIVTSAGAVMCSGYNGVHQLGIVSFFDRYVMTSSNAGNGTLTSGITKVFCGSLHACALSTANTVYCWGASGNPAGQIGASSGSFATLSETATMLSLGTYHTCGLFSGTVKCFGYNENGQLARGTSDVNINAEPLNSLFEGAVTDIACGSSYTCVRVINGGVQCVGSFNNFFYHGELGAGSAGSTSIVSVQGLPATVSPTSNRPSYAPSRDPTFPTTQPTRNPVGRPTRSPTRMPTVPPTRVPSRMPTSAPNRKTSAGMVVSVNAFVCFLLFLFM